MQPLSGAYSSRFRHTLQVFMAVTLLALLGGCASTIRSEVTTFNQLTSSDTALTYTIDDQGHDRNDLAYQTYRLMLNQTLTQNRFVSVSGPNTASAALRIVFDYGIESEQIQTSEPVILDNGWYGGYGAWGPGPFGYRPYWGAGFYGDPFWTGPRVIGTQQVVSTVYRRLLNVTIFRQSDQQKIYEVSVSSLGKINNLTPVMRYLMRSAFEHFPAPDGSVQHIQLKIEDQP